MLTATSIAPRVFVEAGRDIADAAGVPLEGGL